MVIAQMATYPARGKALRWSVESLLCQVDKLFITLNNYGEVPKFLAHPKIECQIPPTDLGDRGKVAWPNKPPIFLVDDDLWYPNNYIRELLRHLEAFPIVGVHGSIVRCPFSDYYRDRTVFMFSGSLSKLTKVDILGTGTIAYRDFDFGLSDAPENNALDAYFAVKAERSGIDRMCINREAGWIRQIKTTSSIYGSRIDTPTRILRDSRLFCTSYSSHPS